MQKVDSIQYLRGIAAVSVVAAHSIEYPMHLTGVYITIAGRFGVILFFVISGFIITMVSGRGTFEPLDFALKRLVRVVPMYWLVTIFTALLALLSPAAFKRTTFDLIDMVKSLAFIPYYSPSGDGGDMIIKPIMKLGWTLNYEMLFYLVFGSLFFLRARLRAVGTVFFFIALYAAGWLWHSDSAIWVFYTDYFPLFFCGGVLLGLAYLEGWIDRMGKREVKLAGIATILLATFILVVSPAYHHSIRNSLIAVFCVLLSLVAISAEAHGWLYRSKLLGRLGDATFSIYLVHLFWVGTASSLGRKLLFLGAVPSYLLTVVIAFVGGVLAGVVTHYLVERPLTDYLRKYIRKDHRKDRQTKSEEQTV